MSILLTVSPDLLKAHVQSYTRKDGTFVQEHDDQRQAAAPKPAAKRQPKTGAAAKPKMVTVGSAKYPRQIKSSEKLKAKHEDGSTHHVGGFKAPDYPSNGGPTDGDVEVHHDGKHFTFTGKKGTNRKTGEDSYEFRNVDHEAGLDSRAWVTRSGHLMND